MNTLRFQRAGRSRKTKPEKLSVVHGDDGRPCDGDDEEGGSGMIEAKMFENKPAMRRKLLQIHLG